jgi:hypothetical protein
MFLVLKTSALDIPLQEKVTTILFHNDTTFAYIQYPQNCKILSVIQFSWCRPKSNYEPSKQLTEYLKSKVSILCWRQLFSIWAGMPHSWVVIYWNLQFCKNIICGGTCNPSEHCITVITRNCNTLWINIIIFSCPMNVWCDSVCCFIGFTLNISNFVCNPCFSESKYWIKSEKTFNTRWSLASMATSQKGMSAMDAFAVYCMRKHHTTFYCFCFHSHTCQLLSYFWVRKNFASLNY